MRLFSSEIAAFRARARREYWVDLVSIVIAGISVFLSCAIGLGLALLQLGVVP